VNTGSMQGATPIRIQLGSFEFDLKAGELRHGANGKKIRLQEQPFQILLMLVDGAGEVVSRENIKKKLWPNDTVVEFDASINTAIGKLRQALGDTPERPKYVETVARRGYRLLVPVKCLEPGSGEQLRAEVDGAQRGAATTRQPEAGGLMGREISHYRVLEVIGGGGMGLVYKAEDLKLGRRVALKFLPEELARDSISLQRFEREARTAATLNHRNICTIYEVEEHDGQPCIVMELLEGETLRDRLTAWPMKPITVDQILQIAIQVCDGLEAAHQREIIHRDIKPANIFLTTSGQVKILDFGLAKFVAAKSEAVNTNEADIGLERALAASASADRAASVDHTLTRTGSAMGTAGYMSPEQVRGEKLDARTDIFSFGLVLYEMATGERAFSGETAAVVHHSILHNSPVPVRELNSMLPASLLTAIDKCLEKERTQRFQCAAEVRAALEEVRRIATPGSLRSRRWKRIAFASLAIFLIAAGAAGIWWWRRPLALRAFQKYSMTTLTSTGNVAFADISPDGRYLAYADDEIGKQSIWVQQLATSATARVLGPVPYYLGRGLRFTPDGNYLYYSQRDTDASSFSLYRLAVMGGSPQRILAGLWGSNSTSSDAVDLSPDGKKIVFARYTDEKNYLLTANADGSGERRLLALPAKEQMRVFAWSPDGQTIAFGIDEKGLGSMNCIAVIPSQGGKEQRILRSIGGMFGLAWLPDQSGFAVVGGNGETEHHTLWIVSYPDGSLRRISNDVADYYGVSLDHEAGRLMSIQKQMDSSLWVAPALNPSQAAQLRDSAGREDGLVGVVWLPEERLVYVRGGRPSELWVVDRDGSNRRQLTGNWATTPSATPAGATIIFSTGGANLWTINADGSNLKRITGGSTTEWNPELSPDGKWITYYSVEGPRKMSLAGGESTKLDPNGDYATISPNGRWIAFDTWNEKAKKSNIKIVASDGKGSPRFLPFPVEPQVPESTNMGPLPIRWTADGSAITYVRTQNGVSNIWSQPVDGSPAKQLTNFTTMLIWRHAWSPDGKYLVMARGNFSRDAVMLTDIH